MKKEETEEKTRRISNNYDIIIVGAGPGGLKCAEKLSSSKFKVLLLEKNKMIGPKICAGGLTICDIEYLKPPKKLIDCEYSKIKVNTLKNRVTVNYGKPFVFTIDRDDLGQWQLNKIDRNKIEVRTSAKVTQITRRYIIINNKEKVYYKYLIGADGSKSIVRRYVGLKSKLLEFAIQYLLPKQKYRDFEFFFDSKLFHSWYAWIFPHKKYVSVGAGCDPKFLSKNRLIKNFKLWLKKNKITISTEKLQSFPLNCDYQGYKFKNIYLVGDAAGLASPLTGKGIYQALVSGEEVAKEILDKNYKSEKIKKLVKAQNFHKRILKIMVHSGFLRNFQFELLAIMLKNKWLVKKLVKAVA